MDHSLIVPEDTKVLPEMLEEDVGLAWPPFDEQDVMAAESCNFDLSQRFFNGIDDDHKKLKQTKHGKGKQMSILIKVLKPTEAEINGCYKILNDKCKKETKKAASVDNVASLEPCRDVLEKVQKTCDNATTTEATEKIGCKKVLDDKFNKASPNETGCKKTAALLDEASLELKFNSTRRKLNQNYKQVAREKKRRQIQVLNPWELPQLPNIPAGKKCKLRSMAVF